MKPANHTGQKVVMTDSTANQTIVIISDIVIITLLRRPPLPYEECLACLGTGELGLANVRKAMVRLSEPSVLQRSRPSHGGHDLVMEVTTV